MNRAYLERVRFPLNVYSLYFSLSDAVYKLKSQMSSQDHTHSASSRLVLAVIPCFNVFGNYAHFPQPGP